MIYDERKKKRVKKKMKKKKREHNTYGKGEREASRETEKNTSPLGLN